ncbi:hypothetical protein HKX48_007498, partial [Thoreauomyces humboldtii]
MPRTGEAKQRLHPMGPRIDLFSHVIPARPSTSKKQRRQSWSPDLACEVRNLQRQASDERTRRELDWDRAAEKARSSVHLAVRRRATLERLLEAHTSTVCKDAFHESAKADRDAMRKPRERWRTVSTDPSVTSLPRFDHNDQDQQMGVDAWQLEVIGDFMDCIENESTLTKRFLAATSPPSPTRNRGRIYDDSEDDGEDEECVLTRKQREDCSVFAGRLKSKILDLMQIYNGYCGKM